MTDRPELSQRVHEPPTDAGVPVENQSRDRGLEDIRDIVARVLAQAGLPPAQ
jgi:hypothetical protein